jgi:hypothetical protein
MTRKTVPPRGNRIPKAMSMITPWMNPIFAMLAGGAWPTWPGPADVVGIVENALVDGTISQIVK